MVGRVVRSDGGVLAPRVRLADDFFSRLRGLLGVSHLAPGEGLWITKCTSVHMLGMSIELDLVFLDRDDRIVRIVPNAARNRPYFAAPGARSVLELGVGSAQLFAVGDVLAFEKSGT